MIPTDFTRTATENTVLHQSVLEIDQTLSAHLRKLALYLPPTQTPLETEQKREVESESEVEAEELASRQWRLFSLFLSAWVTVLYRRSRESDFSLSSFFSQPDGKKAAVRLIGPISVEDKLTFSQLYSLVYQSVAAARNQEAQSGKLQGKIHFEVDPQLMSAADPHAADLDTSETVAKQTTLSAMDVILGISSKAGQKSAWSEREYVLKLDYNPKLFLSQSIEELLTQIKFFLSQVTDATTSLLTSSERSILEYSLITSEGLSCLPDPTKSLNYDWPGPIAACFHSSAKKTPDAIAVQYQDQSITYATLDKLTDQLACALARAGVGKGDVVSLYGHRSPPVVWAIMGILKSGAAYSMLDPKYPPSRIMACLDIAKPKAFVRIEAAGELASELSTFLDDLKLNAHFVLPDMSNQTEVEKWAQYTEPPHVEIEKNDVAVVTFTSGSTGLPKGVKGVHVSLTHFYPWMSERFGLNAKDRFSMCSGIAHDPLQRDIFTPLFFGAAVYIPTEQEITEPGMLAKWMEKNAVTVSCLTPAMGQLLTSDEKSGVELKFLRKVFFVGDMLIKRDVIKLMKLAPNVHMINMYGSTETQRAVGYLEVTSLASLEPMKEVIAVGVGMKDVQVIILNNAGLLAGIGETGEIYMRSPHIAVGYVDPSATAEKFLPNPFHPKHTKPNPYAVSYQEIAKKSGKEVVMKEEKEEKEMALEVDRLYRTGDLGRYVVGGDVECAGRADDQVKIRGFRIELGEINAFLSKHPFAKENITIVREDRVGDKRLVSYVVLTEAAKAAGKNANALQKIFKDHLRSRLPVYMIPSNIVVLESLPLTPNGKINRGGLPKPEDVRTQEAEEEEMDEEVEEEKETKEGAGGGSRKRKEMTGKKKSKQEKKQKKKDPVEAALQKVWESLLGVCPINVNDNFFDLGGHSLLATQLTAAMATTLRQVPHGAPLADQVTISMLLEFPTVRSLAQALQSKSKSTEKPFDLMKEADDVMTEFAVSSDLVSSYSPIVPKAVFLTGGTGFLGAFLIHELLKQHTSVEIWCGVRASSKIDGYHRIRKNLINHKLWTDDYSRRIFPVLCDLSKEKFGLSETDYTNLSTTVDTIIHNGAYVHWLLPYQKMKPTNVMGTLEVLRLASTSKLKPVHYVSTTSVFDGSHHASLSEVSEDDPLPSADGVHGGYPQSKWVAEKVLMVGRTKGVPVSIYRPGYVTGDTQNGLWNTDDFLCRLIKGCIQLKSCPFSQDTQSHAAIDMTPVDHVARQIVALVNAPQLTAQITPTATQSEVKEVDEKKGKVFNAFNVVNPEPFPFYRLFEKVKSYGYEMEYVPYDSWRTTLLEKISEEGKTKKAEDLNALAPISSQFKEGWIKNLTHAPYLQTNLTEALQIASAASTSLPSFDFPDIDKVLEPSLDYLSGCGFLPSTKATEGRGKEKIALLTRTNRHKS